MAHKLEHALYTVDVGLYGAAFGAFRRAGFGRLALVSRCYVFAPRSVPCLDLNVEYSVFGHSV